MNSTFIGIEAGGTKIVCGTGTGPGDLGTIVRMPTTTPEKTMGAIAGYVADRQAEGTKVAAVGLASFGPLTLDVGSPSYGHLGRTPKAGWADADLLGPIRRVFDGPIGLDTDVNGAALGELRWGAGEGLQSLAYVTVGTGVGVGAIVGGRPIHGLLHPEMGHILVRRHPDDPFAGRCPSHGDCLEGLACGPAWLDRWGAPSPDLPEDIRRRAVEIQAYYLGQLVMSMVLSYSPHRIVMGGGVLAEESLLPAVRSTAVDLLSGYIAVPPLTGDLSDFLHSPGLGNNAGVLGAIALAHDAL